MLKTITSNSITFLDTSDNRILDVYITSNLPTTQIYNANDMAYTPDWSKTNLQLNADVYLDSKEIVPDIINWYTKIGTTETLVGSTASLIVSTNVLSNNPIITYVCKAKYQNIEAFKEITFVRVDTGHDGSDGTSINILGTYNTLEELQTTHPIGNAGDAYIVSGRLYVWAVDDAQWEDVGNIQGPKGEDAKSIVLSGSSQVFKISKTNVSTPAIITVTAQTFNTNITDWTYSTNGGQTFLSTVPTGVSRNGNVVTITGSTITSNSIVIKASDGEVEDVFTIYKAVDGSDGNKGNDGAPAPIAFLTNENVTFSANAQGQIPLTTITSNIVAYNGTTKVMPTIGTITGAPTGMTVTPSNITASDEVRLTITIANNSTLGSTSSNMGVISVPITYPVSAVLSLTWSKVNTGTTGVGVRSTTVTYGVSDSASTRPADTAWQSTIPTVADGKYLWTRTIIDYTDDTIADTVTYTYAKQGTKGDTGSTGSSVTVSSIQYQEGTSATVPPTNTWSNSVVAVAEGKFLWTKTTFSDGKMAYGVAKQGVSGSNASLVDITPSALYFKSTKGKDGEFTPDFIYLYPRFQNVTYNGWQYSIDGGSNWIAVNNTSGLSVGTYGSVANTLRIANTSTLYTDTVTSISFRCNSLTSGIYDTVSIAKIYDVVDLQIGGRNYILDTETEWSTNGRVAANGSAYGIYKTGLNSIFEQLLGQQLMISFEGMVETTDGSNGQILIYGTNGNPKYRFDSTNFLNIIPNQWHKFSAPVRIVTIEANTGEARIEFYGTIPTVSQIHIRKLKLEIGNKVTDWTPAPEDLIEKASNTTVMLSNEAHLFEADLNGVAIPTTVVLDVIGLKGATQAPTTVGAITGIPSTGMAVSTSNNSTTNTKITITVNNRLTSAIADYGTLTIPITVNGRTINKIFSWAKSNDISNLNIGGRNLLYDSTFNEGLVWPQVRGTIIAAEPDKPNSKIYHVLHTNESTTVATSSPIQNDRRMYLDLKAGESLAMSYDFYADDLDKVGNTVATLRISDSETSTTITSLANHTKVQLLSAGVVAGKWQRVSFVYTATEDTSGWFIFGLYARAEIGMSIDYKYREVKVERGNKITDWTPAIEDMVNVTFQLYAPNGYLLTHDIPELTLQTFAYNGSQTINDATFKWFNWSNEEWIEISGATNTSLTITKADVLKSCTYKCEMTYKGIVYTATETVEDKTDIYDSLIRVNAKRTSANGMYWVLYATVYSEEGEKDALLGPVDETAPSSPATGAYWYQINPNDYSITLKKYSGTAWVTSTDQQELFYDWFLFKDTTDMVSLGNKSKVKIIKSGDFVNTCNVQCNIFDAENTVLSRNNQVLNDPTDPIVSETAPSNPIDGQIWIKVGANSTYVLSVWSTEHNKWIISNADTQNKIYVTKPTQYNTGDLWIVDSNYQPIIYKNGIAQTTRHPEKTMLRATATSQTYSDAHWEETLKYQEELDKLTKDVGTFKQFFSFDDTGMTMQAKDTNGVVSEFKTRLTNTELGFYQGNTQVAYINNNQLNISKAEITNGLAITGTTPTLQIGNFTIIQESNGSLSIGLKS